MLALLAFAAGLAAAAADEELSESSPRPPDGSREEPPPPVSAGPDPRISEVSRDFLPFVDQRIDAIRQDSPGILSDWKKVAARIPYLTEAVAMYFCLEDPATPMAPKLTIAASLLYLISPVDVIPDEIPFIGQIDDAGVLLAAIYEVYGAVDQGHVEMAKAWLRIRGVDPKPLFALGKQFPAQAASPSSG